MNDMKNRRMIVNKLKVVKDKHILKRYFEGFQDMSTQLDVILSFPKKASKKDITRWLIDNGYEEYIDTPYYENDSYYWGSAGSRCGRTVVRRGNKVYIFNEYDV